VTLLQSKSGGRIAGALLQAALVLALAPLLNGVVKQAKARWQMRRGPSIWQPYWDLYKFFHKDEVRSQHASWILAATPYVYFGAALVAALLVPAAVTPASLSGAGDLLLVVGLLALGRFFLALAGLDTGSAFGGMGSSREMAFAAVIEPALLAGALSVAARLGTTDPSALAAAGAASGSSLVSPGHLLAFAALLIVAVAETGRVPVDNPDTHLELTMVHEGMLLEYSGPSLALLTWGALLRQLVVLTLLIDLFFPWGIAGIGTGGRAAAALSAAGGALLYAAKLGVLGALLAAIETAYAKMRIFRVPELLATAFGLGVLATVAGYLVG
jgi:formate hydrogenlyase subunit 4